MNPTAYPLTWPDGWPRIPAQNRERSRFRTSYAGAFDNLMNELSLLGASSIVVSSNAPLRRDGRPYTDAMADDLDDPGVAVWFLLRGEPRGERLGRPRMARQGAALGLREQPLGEQRGTGQSLLEPLDEHHVDADRDDHRDRPPGPPGPAAPAHPVASPPVTRRSVTNARRGDGQRSRSHPAGAVRSRRRRIRRRAFVLWPLLLDRTLHGTTDEAPLEDDEDDRHWDEGEQRRAELERILHA